MNNEKKARELSKKFARQYHANNWPEWSDDEAFHYSNEEINNACLEMAQWKDEQAKQLYNIIIKLWDILDWIDTYSDLKINGSEDDLYFSKIEDKTKERFNLVKSDGYNLFINDEKITNNEHNTTKTD